MKHELKTREQFFKSTWAGSKTFEIRKDDRKFEVDDEVILKEWEPYEGDDYLGYTGREIHGFISYVTDFGQKHHVVFEFRESYRTRDKSNDR